jgi:diaminopimelate decarboxylase
MLAKAAGFGGDSIMFSSNATPEEEFKLARRINAVINLDDISHIEFLAKTAGIPETICCRFNPGGVFCKGNAIMDTPGEAKYGFTRGQLTEGFRRLMEMGVKSFGLHAFLASNELDGGYYPALARLLFNTAAELSTETGAHISFVNLSGGIGIPYRPEDKPCDIEAVGDGIRQAFEEVLMPSGLGDVAVYTELGRYMTGPYGCLVTTAVHQKHIYKDYVALDACAVDLLRPAMYKAYHHITVMGKQDAPCCRKYDITGSLCENNDKFAIDRMMPEIATGDLLVIHDTGAHGWSMGYNYNGKLKSAEVLLKEDGSVELIRRAEKPEDYFATLDFTGLFA